MNLNHLCFFCIDKPYTCWFLNRPKLNMLALTNTQEKIFFVIERHVYWLTLPSSKTDVINVLRKCFISLQLSKVYVLRLAN